MVSHYRLKLRWLIVIATIIRCIFAYNLELGNDEVYYLTYAEFLDRNHFDHPPMVGLLIRFFTLNLHWVSDFSIRLGAVFLAAFNTWLLASLIKYLMSERAALIGAILYTASIYSSIISGLFILPDSIANTFWLASLYCMVIIVKSEKSDERTNHFLLLGLFIGLAMLSKVHSIFLWFGFLGYIFFNQKKIFEYKALYLSILISIIFILPIWLWNEEYNYITWKFHSNRISIIDSGFRFDYFLQTFLGQIFYNNPFLIYLYSVVLAYILKDKIKINGISRNIIYLLLFCSIPIIIASTGLSLFRQTLPHWSGAGFFGLMIISALWLDSKLDLDLAPKCRKILNLQLGFTLSVAILIFIIIKWYPGNIVPSYNKKELGKGDLTLDLTGWKDLEKQFKEVRAEDFKNNLMYPEDALLVNNWFPAGHFYYYVTKPLGMRLIADGRLVDIHKFAWINLSIDPIQKGENAYYISASNMFKEPEEIYGQYFENVQLRKVLVQKRSGQEIRLWYIYHLKKAKDVIGNKHPLNYTE